MYGHPRRITLHRLLIYTYAHYLLPVAIYFPSSSTHLLSPAISLLSNHHQLLQEPMITTRPTSDEANMNEYILAEPQNGNTQSQMFLNRQTCPRCLPDLPSPNPHSRRDPHSPKNKPRPRAPLSTFPSSQPSSTLTSYIQRGSATCTDSKKRPASYIDGPEITTYHKTNGIVQEENNSQTTRYIRNIRMNKDHDNARNEDTRR